MRRAKRDALEARRGRVHTDEQLLLFDIRFSKEPLQSFNGHINNYHTKLVSPQLVIRIERMGVVAKANDRA